MGLEDREGRQHRSIHIDHHDDDDDGTTTSTEDLDRNVVTMGPGSFM